MTLSQLALEDVEALCFGHSFLMADPMGPLLDQDEEEALSPSSSLEGKAPASSPLSSFSSSSSSSSSSASSLSPYQTMSFSPLSSTSPPPSPPSPAQSSLFLGTKARADLPSLPWLVADDLLDSNVGADDGKDDAFDGMDWMSEKIDLSEFDLDSLIGSCSSEESRSSPEDLLASLNSHMDLELDSFAPGGLGLGLPLPSVPALPLEPTKAEAVKCEPLSPAPSSSPSSLVYALELGSEVDVLDAEKTAPSVTPTFLPDPSGSVETPAAPVVLSLPAAGHLVVLLANKEDPAPPPLPGHTDKTSTPSDCESDSGIESVAGSPLRQPSPPPPRSPAGSSRTKPYFKPEPAATPSPKTPKVKSVSGAPRVVEKKLKKMEQNKTAATRYRQKKRVEQELLVTEREELEKRNRELAEKAESISREIQYLKDLMEEVRKHRRGKSSSVA